MGRLEVEGSTENINEEAKNLLDLSQQAFEGGDLSRAEELLGSALRADPMLLLREHMPNNVPVTLGPNTLKRVGERKFILVSPEGKTLEEITPSK